MVQSSLYEAFPPREQPVPAAMNLRSTHTECLSHKPQNHAGPLLHDPLPVVVVWSETKRPAVLGVISESEILKPKVAEKTKVQPKKTRKMLVKLMVVLKTMMWAMMMKEKCFRLITVGSHTYILCNWNYIRARFFEVSEIHRYTDKRNPLQLKLVEDELASTDGHPFRQTIFRKAVVEPEETKEDRIEKLAVVESMGLH